MTFSLRLHKEFSGIAVIANDGGFLFEEPFFPEDSYQNLLRQISNITTNLSDEHKSQARLGLCVTDLTYSSDGAITSGAFPCLSNMPLFRDLQAATGLSCILGNDAQCLALGSLSKPDESLFSLIIDEELSGAIVTHGTLLRGRNQHAGQIGHTTLPFPVPYELDGRMCACGRTGCLTHFISLSGIEEDYRQLTNTTRTADEIISAAVAGDIIADSVIQVLEDRIARALSPVINLLDPDRIIISGRCADKDRLPAILPRKWPGYVIANKPATEITVLPDRHKTCLRGVARLSGHQRHYSA